MSLTTVDSGLISSGAITLTTQVTGTLPEANGGTGTTTGYYGFKNRIINGAMVIDQRNAGASVTPTDGQYTVDRFQARLSQASKYSTQQSSTAAVGFVNSLKVTSASAYAVLTADYFFISQQIEGYNCSDLGWGTANAKTVTLSFWVQSSLTGTFGGALRAGTGSTQSYPFSYTISSANTWTQINVVIAGPTSTWSASTTNGSAIEVDFSLGSGTTYSGTAGAWAAAVYFQPTGSVSVVGTSGATFYITGVQLEKGSTATSFDYRPYGTELQLCQRYYEVDSNNNTSLFWSGNTTSGATYYLPVKYAVTKRSTATVTLANIVNSGFPNTTTIGEQSISGFRGDTTANSTISAGYFRATWVASAEL